MSSFWFPLAITLLAKFDFLLRQCHWHILTNIKLLSFTYILGIVPGLAKAPLKWETMLNRQNELNTIKKMTPHPSNGNPNYWKLSISYHLYTNSKISWEHASRKCKDSCQQSTHITLVTESIGIKWRDITKIAKI